MVPGSGALAATVPGAVEAWLLLLRDYGTWKLGDILEFAIHLRGSRPPDPAAGPPVSLTPWLIFFEITGRLLRRSGSRPRAVRLWRAP